MDTLTRQLAIEIAKTVLRVLDAQPAKGPQPVQEAAPPPKVVPAVQPKSAQPAATTRHGDVVRFWDGHKYSCGTVLSVCRNKEGRPPCVNVRVEKAGGRGKTFRVETAKAEVIKGGAA